MREKGATLVLLVASLPIISLVLTPQDDTQAEREAMYYRYLEFPLYDVVAPICLPNVLREAFVALGLHQ